MKKIAEKWYLVLIIGFLVFAALVFGIFGKGSIISVHDNLDLFVAQFQMLKNTGAFWKHGVEVPFLGGISRDVLPSEFSLYSLLYMILPSYYAYVAGYLLKIVIGTFSMVLLARDLFKDQYGESKPVIFLAGFAYALRTCSSGGLSPAENIQKSVGRVVSAVISLSTVILFFLFWPVYPGISGDSLCYSVDQGSKISASDDPFPYRTFSGLYPV